MSDPTDVWRRHAGRITAGATGALLVVSLFWLGSGLAGTGETGQGDATRMVKELTAEAKSADEDLTKQHQALLAQLPGADAERVDRDRATGRSLLLSLTGSSASTRTVKQTQRMLDARYDVLDHDSRALTEFIPEWMAATGASRGAGTTYRLAYLDIDMRGARSQDLDYCYLGMTRLDPVSADDQPGAKSEVVVFIFCTAPDGSVTSLDAYRASSRTRDGLLARQEPQGTDGTKEPAPTATPDGGG